MPPPAHHLAWVREGARQAGLGAARSEARTRPALRGEKGEAYSPFFHLLLDGLAQISAAVDLWMVPPSSGEFGFA
jgi:hypothetical protein